MTLRIPRDLATLFGSGTRVRVLAALAGATSPMTAYRIAKVGQVAIPKAYGEVKRLAGVGLVKRRGSGWLLVDPDVRVLLQKRVPVLWWGDWSTEKRRRVARTTELRRRSLARGLPAPPRGWKSRTEVRRDPRKDQLLRDAGMRTSQHD